MGRLWSSSDVLWEGLGWGEDLYPCGVLGLLPSPAGRMRGEG